MINDYCLKILNSVALGVVAFLHSASEVSAQDWTGGRPVAVVYAGTGDCEDNCSNYAGDVAEKSGFSVVYVKENSFRGWRDTKARDAQLSGARVWIQPGGYAGVMIQNMPMALVHYLRNRIQDGMGYVGFCAGAFAATYRVGGSRLLGLNVFPGITRLAYFSSERNDVEFSLESINWGRQKRTVYFEGGAYLDGLTDRQGKPRTDLRDGLGNRVSVEIISRYLGKDQSPIAAARTTYGKGRVFITGFHPEAPEFWTKEDGITDPDGTDHDLAKEMIVWAATLTL